jgi:hypothetical protein
MSIFNPVTSQILAWNLVPSDSAGSNLSVPWTLQPLQRRRIGHSLIFPIQWSSLLISHLSGGSAQKKRHRWFQTSPTPDIFDSKSFKGFDVFFDGLLTKLSACRQCIAPGEGVDVAVASEVYSSCEHHISTTLNQLYITYIIIHHLLLHYVVIYVDVHESIHSDGVFPCQIENGDHPDGWRGPHLAFSATFFRHWGIQNSPLGKFNQDSWKTLRG